MKHLYSIVFVFVALTSFNLSIAQNIIPNLTTINTSGGTCNGYAEVSPTGGSGPYSYVWSTGATTSYVDMLCAGAYTVTIYDGVDTLTLDAFILDGCSGFTGSYSSTPPSAPGMCDGTATFTPYGGTAPYTYSWSNGATTQSLSNLCAGYYYYNVYCTDMMGCTTTIPVTYNGGSSPISINLTTTDDLSGNCTGSASAAPTGGSGSYSYVWSTGETTSSISGLCSGSYSVYITDSNQDSVSYNFLITNPCSNLVLSTSSTNCSPGNCDGTVQATVTGGSGPYTFSISGGPQTGMSLFSNLCAGTYTVTVMDINGCSMVAAATVTDPSQPAPISINLTTLDDATGTCTGSASVSPTGGSGSYTYQWSIGSTTSSVSNLCLGTYAVVVWDANGIDSASAYFTITNLCAGFSGYITTTPTSGPTSCDGTIMVNVLNGTAPYTYSWNNGSTTPSNYNLCVGSYTVTCTDATGCIASTTGIISDSGVIPSMISANLTTLNDYTNNCNGSATVSPTGGTAPYTIVWSNGVAGNSISNLCAGIYSVSVWDAVNDSTTIEFIIADSFSTYNNNPYPNGSINDTLYTDLVTNCIIDYNVIDSASLYQAVYNSSNQSLYVTWAVYSPTDTVYISDTLALIGNPGYYSLTISVYCPNKSGNDYFKIESVIYFDGSQVWTSTLGLNEQDGLNNVSIYPNPFSNSISIDNKDGMIQSLKLIDLNGRILSEMNQINPELVTMNQLETISAGTYLLVLSGNNTSKAYRVIK